VYTCRLGNLGYFEGNYIDNWPRAVVLQSPKIDNLVPMEISQNFIFYNKKFRLHAHYVMMVICNFYDVGVPCAARDGAVIAVAKILQLCTLRLFIAASRGLLATARLSSFIFILYI